MADIQADSRSKIARWRRLCAGVAGLWLLFLYALFSSFVVLSFSAYQLQTTIQSYKAANGKAVQLWSVRDLYGKWKVDSSALESASMLYTSLSEDIEEKTLRGQNLRKDMLKEYDECREDMRSYVSGLYGKILPIDEEYANIITKNLEKRNFCRKGYPKEFTDAYIAQIEHQQSRRLALARSRDALPRGKVADNPVPKIKALIDSDHSFGIEDKNNEHIENAQKTMNIITYNQRSIDDWESQKDRTWLQIKGFQQEINFLFSERGQDFDDVIGNYLISFSYFEAVEQMPYLGRFIPDFSKMPPDTLTLILVLAMGALGGTIQLSRRHLAQLDVNDEQGPIQPSYYVFRPFLGAITALSVYILVKAGVLVASTPTAAGDTANLSPFFISFLAIVSGLLAEQALETIEQAGGNFFTRPKPPETDRWAYGLDAALRGEDKLAETYERNLKDLVRAIDVTEEQITKWVKETEPVGESHQKMIAAFFHLPLRTLFTDLKS